MADPEQPLSPEDARQLQEALKIAPDQPLVEALQLMLLCSQPTALRVAQERLHGRPNLLAELRSALYGTEPLARGLALQLVSRMPQVPRELRGAATHAVQCTLTLDPLSDEVLVALMALYALSEGSQHLQPEVERVCRHVGALDSERAQLIARIGGAVLAAMGRFAEARTERWNANRARLVALAQKGQLDAARSLLAELFPKDDPSDPDGGMTARVELCEAAAATLPAKTHASSVRSLLELALEYAQIFASWSTSGGEGMARMVKVNKLRTQLKRLR